MTSDWQIGAEELARAREVVAAYLPPTPLRSYPQLDAFVAHGVQVLVKHENFQPTGAFKARNGLVAMAWLTEEEPCTDDRPEELACGLSTSSPLR